MSRPGNWLYLLGATFQRAYQGDFRQWQPIVRGYEETRGERLTDDKLALFRLFAPFQTWIRFSWYWSSDEPPAGDKTGTVRPDILKQLFATIQAADAAPTA